MKKIFDASAIMVLAKNYPTETVEHLKDEHLLDLTIYELGNAIWKINKLLKKPDVKTALESMEQVLDLTALMKTHAARDRQTHMAIMENAFKHSLTYYDSAYITAAQQEKYTLVTTDKRLQKAANTANINTKDIESLLTQNTNTE